MDFCRKNKSDAHWKETLTSNARRAMCCDYFTVTLSFFLSPSLSFTQPLCVHNATAEYSSLLWPCSLQCLMQQWDFASRTSESKLLTESSCVHVNTFTHDCSVLFFSLAALWFSFSLQQCLYCRILRDRGNSCTCTPGNSTLASSTLAVLVLLMCEKDSQITLQVCVRVCTVESVIRLNLTNHSR